ncbi:cytochrome c oxidase subunit 6A1, mitochondrial [Orussus abietinus]|uniref:cytochrome c oxidase subunit 6A1, mitochondrial n=1 Tax=Orussus abietinus TaxID=222816 RepID=UPI000626D689|nr:cytochrome c oxidase subunit 6A1, mitochondrial [Orussus abietinus]
MKDPRGRTCPPASPCPDPTLDCQPDERTRRASHVWKLLTLFVALPWVVVSSALILTASAEEERKPRPEFIPYEYMYRRTTPFPWGDGNHSLFHNPVRNALPDGYEVDDPYAVKDADKE